MFHVGQMVECVDDGFRYLPGYRSRHILRRGAIYTVSTLGFHPDVECVCVFLLEVPLRSELDFGYNVDRFRPLQDSKLEVFRAMLAPIKHKELVP